MKFLVILLFYISKCSGDSSDYHRNLHITAAANAEESELVILFNDHERETSTAKSTSMVAMSTQELISHNIITTEQSGDEAKISVKSSTTPSYLQIAQLLNNIGDNFYAPTAEPRCLALPEGIYLTILHISVIGLTMLILIVIIVFLLYALHKAKSNMYKCIPNETIQTVTVTPREFSPQTSQDKPSPTIVQLNGITIDDTYFKHTTSLRDVSRNDLSPISSSSSSSRRDSKILKLIRNNNPQTNLILRKQIEEICQGVLNNPIALKSRDPKEHLLDVEVLEKRSSRNGLAREKSISSPQLDLIYDTLQNQKHSSRSSSSSNIDIESLPEELVSDKPPTDDCTDKLENNTGKPSENDNEIPIYDNPQAPDGIDVIPVYDSVPSRPPNCKVYNDNKISIKVVAENDDNLLVLDFNKKENETEPAYENAKKNEFKF